VGASILSRDGRLFTGVNIENASFGLSMCAERVALFTAIAAGARVLDAIAVVGPEGVVTLPCGACRQVLYEFAPQLRIVYAERGQIKITPLATLLPEAFSAQTLTEGVADRGMR
jgi:cytidine deaminase